MVEQFEYIACQFIANNFNINKKGSPITEKIKSDPNTIKARDECIDRYPELFEEPNFLIKLWHYFFD